MCAAQTGRRENGENVGQGNAATISALFPGCLTLPTAPAPVQPGVEQTAMVASTPIPRPASPSAPRWPRSLMLHQDTLESCAWLGLGGLCGDSRSFPMIWCLLLWPIWGTRSKRVSKDGARPPHPPCSSSRSRLCPCLCRKSLATGGHRLGTGGVRRS